MPTAYLIACLSPGGTLVSSQGRQPLEEVE